MLARNLLRHFTRSQRTLSSDNYFEYLPKKQHLEPSQFESISSSYLNKIHSALQKLREDNPDAELEFSPDSIVFTKKNSVLTLKKESQQQYFVLDVPKKGEHKYFYDLDNENWVNETDGHVLDRLIVKELLKNCYGYLDI